MSEEQRPLTQEEEREFRARQKSRARIMAVGLVALCVLFYLITMVKIGVWG